MCCSPSLSLVATNVIDWYRHIEAISKLPVPALGLWTARGTHSSGCQQDHGAVLRNQEHPSAVWELPELLRCNLAARGLNLLRKATVIPNGETGDTEAYSADRGREEWKSVGRLGKAATNAQDVEGGSAHLVAPKNVWNPGVVFWWASSYQKQGNSLPSPLCSFKTGFLLLGTS